jgi:hypothetical protein
MDNQQPSLNKQNVFKLYIFLLGRRSQTKMAVGSF